MSEMVRAQVIPALTLWQPWACLVEIGAKPYDTRGFPIPRRLLGRRVAIHAAARPVFTDLTQDVRPVDPHIPAKGRQQIGWDWTVPEGLVL